MNGIKAFLRRHFGGADTATADDARFSVKSLLWLLVGWMLLWTLLPSLCLGNVSVDIAENVAWGQNFDWGYDKNPYFGAWLSFAVFKLIPVSIGEYVFYWMSQLSVLIGLFSVYLIAREIFSDRFSAFIAVPLALLIPSFSHSACEFNDDVLSIALYGLTALFFLRGVRKNDGNWLAFGLCAGLAMMTKYLAGVLLLPLGILLFATPEGRKCLKKPWIYLGVALCVLLILPNVIWLIRHDFIAVTYALGRAELDQPRTWDVRWENFSDTWKYFFCRLLLPIMALLIFRRGGRRLEKFGFEQWFVLTVALAPTILSSLFALTTGGQVMIRWTIPYYLFVTLPLVMFYRPCPGARSLPTFAGFMATVAVMMTLVFGHEHLYRHLYRKKKHCNHNVYPGRAIAARLTAEWHRRFDRPCVYVIGRRKQACNMCYYSPDHPRAFFEHDLRQSPWIDPADVGKRGAIILWHDGQTPKYLKEYGSHVIYLEKMTFYRAVPRWMRAWAPIPPEYVIQAALLPPEN